MKYLKPILVVLITISFIMNFMLLDRIDSLEQKLNNDFNQIQGTVGSVTGQVNGLVNDLRKEQRWITPAEVSIGESKPDTGETEVKLSWQIKDCQVNDKVTLYYRQSETDGFTAVPVKSAGGGFFQVVLPYKVKPEPHLDVGVSMTTTIKNDRKPIPAQKMVSRQVKPDNNPGLSYYVSVDRQGSVKSSEIAYTDLEKLNYLTYGFLSVHVDINNNRYNVSLYEIDQVKTKLSNASLKVMNGGALVQEKPMAVREEPNRGRKAFDVTYEPGQQIFTSLVLHLKYEDGQEFDKEIFAQ